MGQEILIGLERRRRWPVARKLSILSEVGVDGATRGMFMTGGWGDRQFAADRLDTQVLTMAVDERHHHFPRRSNSAIAKYADSLRRISLARRII